MSRRGKNLWDFALAAVIVLAMNFASLPKVDGTRWDNIRLLSHRMMHDWIAELDPEIRYDWVSFGDSRALRLNDGALCESLPGGQDNVCLNASTTSGDWFTAHLVYNDLALHVRDDTRFVIFVSDYWLEGHDTGLIPRRVEYAAMGSPAKAASSFLPMSALRSTRIAWLQDSLASWARRWHAGIGGPAVLRAQEESEARAMRQNLFRSNVDAWFLPISATQREERARLARRTLEHMIAAGHRPILVHLPNMGHRDQFVDEHFPGRREQFRTSMQSIADEFDLPFINLDGSPAARGYFKDFHHLNSAGRDRVIPILARKIARLPR